MSLDDLYRDIILDHYRNPRNAAILDHIPVENVHENPVCGDMVKLETVVNQEGILTNVLFDGRGCAISTASASIMTEEIKGKSIDEVKAIAGSFIQIMRGEKSPDALDGMGDLVCLKGVIQYPLRVKCATLAWHALLDNLIDR
jgi:nitrogen fixation NifU-like protein